MPFVNGADEFQSEADCEMVGGGRAHNSKNIGEIEKERTGRKQHSQGSTTKLRFDCVISDSRL